MNDTPNRGTGRGQRNVWTYDADVVDDEPPIATRAARTAALVGA